MADDSNVPDTIERSISIAAPVAAVWDLVSIPGWWINSNTIDLSTIEIVADHRAVVHHPEHGDFLVERFDVDAPTSVRFRWLVSGSDEGSGVDADAHPLQTVVTFTLAPTESGTRLSVVESGFASSEVDEPTRRRAYDGNSEGWYAELGAAKSYLEGR